MPKKKIPILKTRKVKGIFKTLRALPYRNSMIYLRVIDGTIFEWLLIFNNELFTGFLVIEPRKGKKHLTTAEISNSAALALSGAMATIDTMIKEKNKLKKKNKVLSN